MNKIVLIVLLLVLGLVGCRPAPPALAPLRIAVAASVQAAAEVLADSFSQQAGQPVEVIAGATGRLMAQIVAGAPYAVLMAADTLYTHQLVVGGHTTGSARRYAYGSLVLWSLDSSVLTAAHLPTWLTEGEQAIALANPRLAPYGRVAERWLEQAGLTPLLSPRLVYGESIAQVNQFVLSGAVRAGFTALSVVATPPQRGYYRTLPTEPLPQALVVTSRGGQAAEAFCDFVLGAAGQRILARFGYHTHAPD